MRAIVIEGPDGAGKTHLMKAMLGRHPEYRAAPRPCTSLGGPMTGQRLVDWIQNYGLMDTCIYDRHPSISGPVYDVVFSRRVAQKMQPWIQGVLYEIHKNARVIYCRPPRRTIIRAVNESPQMNGVERMIHRIIDTYDAIMGSMIPHERYDWTTDDLPSL